MLCAYIDANKSITSWWSGEVKYEKVRRMCAKCDVCQCERQMALSCYKDISRGRFLLYTVKAGTFQAKKNVVHI